MLPLTAADGAIARVSVVANLWARVKASPSFAPTGAAIPASNVDGPAHEREPFRTDTHYFSVVVSEIFLQDGRQWFSTYDPMVFALTEFSYAADTRAGPFVLEPGLLKPHDQMPPQGMLFRDTRVLGLHPFRGDDVALTLILSKVQRTNYASDVLKIVETIGGAVGAAAGLGPFLKVADALLAAADTLFAAPGTTPVVGMRIGLGGECRSRIGPVWQSLWWPSTCLRTPTGTSSRTHASSPTLVYS